MTPFEIEDDATYRVALAQAVQVEARKLLPRDKHRMRGDVLRAIIDQYGWEAIADAGR